MQEQLLDRIREGMDVCDRYQNKIGTAGKIYRPVGVTQQAGYGRPGAGFEPHLRVDTGFLGLGKDLFVPVSHIKDVSGDCVLLDVERDRLDQTTWDKKPSFIQD